ncbi:gluconate 2-dehydrogenase subunit 3 family protein [uncultured Dokdonia sp.]|uniref:gluconate 2-dehydrogenase subunit 3 family protein n=1 Tax=uncultured Dokdonia sp. TaxID=575653 RepID=UPI0026373C99|nr:gluconate 2-dehydrogenase subunit 3 family protein [uncultured Dokdonia sp.]
MNRRQVLKNLGLGATALVATPTILSLLQSCTNEPEFIPSFLTKEEGHALRRMVDLIIPSDEAIPGAVDVGVHQFIDSYWDQVATLENQSQIKLGFSALASQFQTTFNKPLGEGKDEDFDQLLTKYLKSTIEQEQAYEKKLGAFYQAYQNNKSTVPDPDAGSYSLVQNIRGMTIWGWKTSEEIGENVLAYEPIPAQQIGCLPVSEATGGKAYSL